MTVNPKKLENTLFILGKTMGQREALLFLDRNFSVRVTGPQKNVDEQLPTILKAVSLDKIINLASPSENQPSTSKSKNRLETLKKLFPNNLAGMEHGRISQHPSEIVVSTTYGNDDLPYSVNIQMAKGKLAQEHNKQLQEEIEEPNTDLQQIVHKKAHLFYREEGSAISLMSFNDNRLIIIGADAPTKTSINKEKTKKHLLETFDQLTAHF